MINQSVMTAVEQLDYRVTVGDVATHTGLSTIVANQEVINLASLVDGNLQVSETGAIAYKFPKNFREILRKRSSRAKLNAILGWLWQWGFYIFRASFGIVLIISILIVVVAIVLAILAITATISSKDEDDSDDRSGSRNQFGNNIPIFLGNPLELFNPGFNQTSSPAVAEEERPKKKRGFLESVFAFLFGEGNPNADLEARRYQAIAQVIRLHGGGVVAEQIAPFFDKDFFTIDDVMLPVMLKFNGYPEVSEQGTIAYRFPELQSVATEQKRLSAPPYLKEELWVMNHNSSGENFLAIGLGIFYLLASIVLGILLQFVEETFGFLQLVQIIYPLLLGYAILFVTIPLGRKIVISFFNQAIKSRNRERARRAQVVNSPDEYLRSKLKFAAELATNPNVIQEDNLIYTTEEDYLSQQKFD